MKSIGIVGGGASGMMAAIIAKRNHPDTLVSILEQKPMLGKKILVTGNGRCNVTNELMGSEMFRSDHLGLMEQVLNCGSYKDEVLFFEDMGILMKSRNGYLYPRTDQASTVRDALEFEISRLGIQVILNAYVKSVEKTKHGFRCVITDGNGQNKKSLSFDKLVLANGSKASPSQGSDGSGYRIAKSLGHTTTSIVPALVALKTENTTLFKASGVRTNAKVTICIDGIPTASDEGELQLVSYGISGIPVFQVSRFASKALFEKREVTASIDFIPEYSKEEFANYINQTMKRHGTYHIHQLFYGLFPKKLADVFVSALHISKHLKTIDLLTEKDIRQIIKICKEMKLTITDTNGFKNAQTCAGGVPLTEINTNTMESKIIKDLYLIGELLDVDGICGGYNLHFAWLTGKIAGEHI